jgi:hypothetical protein
MAHEREQLVNAGARRMGAQQCWQITWEPILSGWKSRCLARSLVSGLSVRALDATIPHRSHALQNKPANVTQLAKTTAEMRIVLAVVQNSLGGPSF